MTNEEAKKIIFYQWQDFLEHNIDYAGISEAYKMAIKALEQENILDKIRAEIEQKAKPYEIGGRGNGKSIRYGLFMALEIIDKYKAESEDRE